MTNDELIRSVSTLTNKLAEVGVEVERLNNYGHRNRFLIRVLGVAVGILVLLLAGMGWLAVQVADANAKADKNKQTQYITCIAGNDTRDNQTELWNFVVSIAKKPQTTEDKQKLEQFVAFVHKTFLHRDCSNLK